ncbi:Iron-sulfur assembly protein 1 [Vanrija albida]|uniref:Iron-sulfur assembly protein 1 n=1 Tax=Vanrija albida TaxID=181172 RepID=A0ABR3QBS3_9TREE
MPEPTPIPQPKETLLLGNILDVDRHDSVGSLQRLAALYGGIYQLKLKDKIVFVSSPSLVTELCDEARFEKYISNPLKEVRNFAGDGLFTSWGEEPNWTLAHRILVPAFSPVAIKKMQGMMMDIITQMLMSWEHHAGQPFEAANSYTRLTFDTIGWCAFRYRFNSFHTSEMHPFINIMVKLLLESQNRARRPGLLNQVFYNTDAAYRENIDELWRQCDEIVAERRKFPDPEAHDLLNNMILDKDPKTGEHLSDENIRYQMVTFLIAGHETTSGMLTFATYYMLKNPAVLVKAREEADRVIAEAGGNLLKMNHAKLTYIEAILKEALRLQPPAPAFTVTPKKEEGETLAGGYHIAKGQAAAVLLHSLHRDPGAWGPDADEFNPERWLDGREIHPNSWKPFGSGARACIGRIFALQEAQLALALIVARFDLEMADPGYDLAIKQTLTIKPDHFKIVARPRFRNQSILSELMAGGAAAGPKADADEIPATAQTAGTGAAGKLYVFYGSNSGSCDGLAHEIKAEGTARGFDVEVGELDSKVGNAKLPTDAPVIIVTASYEGKPTDNARMFVQSLSGLPAGAAAGVKYLVMGAGHHDWASTFHKIPKYIDQRLADLGGERLLPLHTADAGGDIVGDFEQFKADLWAHFKSDAPTLQAAESNLKAAAPGKGADGKSLPLLKVLPPTANPANESVSAGLSGVGTIVSQEVLTTATPESPETNFIKIKIPDGQTYRAGDYLAVLPKNPEPAVDRALARFGLTPDDQIVLNLGTSFLPANTPIRAGDLLASYVELGQPVTKRLIAPLAEYTSNAVEKQRILALADDYAASVTAKRLSLLDVLELHPSCDAPFEFFLSQLPKMKIRQYSISSTPLLNPDEVSLTFTVHTASSAAGGKALGVASNYLAFLRPGDKVFCSIKSSAEFHPPNDPALPIVMFAAGSGLAPFRGFIEERALQHEAGRKIGKTVLFFGTRTAHDILHADELAKWVRDGVLDFRPVLSRDDGTPLPAAFEGTNVHLVKGTRYAQDRVWEERAELKDWFMAGAEFYTCGSGARLGASLKKTLIDIVKDVARCDGLKSDPEALYEKISRDRYRTDVFL